MDSGSIFTYDHEPPTVQSPWPSSASINRLMSNSKLASEDTSNVDVEIEELDISSLTRLQAEPQEGPTEYKLHLLLRPRTSLSAGTITRHISGQSHTVPVATTLRNPSPAIPASNISRQHRLEQLTTQLLWRLQQSSPYHSNHADNVVLPTLPPATPELRPPEQLSKLTPGLEESRGALYEIGVSDGGTLVGLTSDEMNESLNNLRAMAASLGCSVEIQRMICVGECEWKEDEGVQLTHTDKLYVAEAFVKPEMHAQDEKLNLNCPSNGLPGARDIIAAGVAVVQLRVTLTGATCGKSSLLGTLSTSTLDNGRGKSRLSLLKHRHEIASGITSSVAQELVGYAQVSHDDIRVVNYAYDKVLTWNDIHKVSQISRLALLSDSAGHPRYRRTAVRGLVGWAPHWTFLCIAANEDHSSMGGPTGTDVSEDTRGSFPSANAQISMAHLDLCLRLQIPFVIVITKFDEATKTGLRQLISTLLTRLKLAGHHPVVVMNQATSGKDQDFGQISDADMKVIQQHTAALSTDPYSTTLILLTSAVTGAGIGKLHALLTCLPVPRAVADKEHAGSVFNVDDSFVLPSLVSAHQYPSAIGTVVSGYTSRGAISLGDELRLGPFSVQHVNPSTQPSTPDYHLGTSIPLSHSEDPFLSPRSFTDALARTTASPRLIPSDSTREWRRVRVVSIRNLRLPVRTLRSDQAGTIGVIPLEYGSSATFTSNSSAPLPLVRKGMILSSDQPTASHTFTARFAVEESTSFIVGSVVVVYCATMRSGARVVAVALEHNDESGHQRDRRSNARRASLDSVDQETGFRFEDEEAGSSEDADTNVEGSLLVTFRFVACRECLEVGSKVLIMPSDGLGGDKKGVKGLLGALEGFVGFVVETFG